MKRNTIHPSTKYAKIYAKVEAYNRSARKHGFAEIKFNPKTGLISSFKPNDSTTDGFWSALRFIFTYVYMAWKWDRVQSTKNKVLWG